MTDRRSFGKDNGNAVLTEAQVKEIRKFKGKLSERKAGEKFGVGKTTVGNIWRGITWRHV